MRSLIFLLLLTIVFLTGMIFGIEREQQSDTIVDDDSFHPSDITIGNIEQEQTDDIVVVESIPEEVDMDTPLLVTHKIASTLEAGVKGFYDIVVEVMYQISKMFFS